MPLPRWIRRAARSGSPRRRRPRRGLRPVTLEMLEDRRLLAVLHVGPGATYATIQTAVDAARPGDVVLLGNAQYTESVDLSRMGSVRSGPTGNLTIRGSSRDQAVVAPSGSAAFFNSSPFTGDLTIEQLTVRGAAAGAGVSGVKVQQLAGDLTVADVILDRLSDAGVDVTGVTGKVQIESSRFDQVGDDAQDAAVRLSEVSGAGAILSNRFENGMGTAMLFSSSAAHEAAWLVDDNRIYGDGSLFSTTDTGMRVRLSGDSVTDLTLSRNICDGLAGSAIDVEVQDRAALQTRWSVNSASNLQGSAAARMTFRGQAAGAFLAESNSWSDLFGSGVRVQIEGAADLRAVVQYDAFAYIGDGQGAVPDDGLTVATAADSTGNVDLFLFNNTFSTVSGSGLRITADGAAAVRAVVTDNALDECNSTAAAGGALVVEHGSAAVGAAVDLRLENNSSFRHEDPGYLLRQRGAAVMRLEGTAATAAAQIVAANWGDGVTPGGAGAAVIGTVGMLAPGYLDASLPLMIGDTVWQDDGDGIQDPGEDVVAGVVIRLSGTETAGGAAVNRITQSDAAGTYLFPGLGAGQYTLTVEPPFAMRLATADQGADDAVDSDFDAESAQASVVLVATLDDRTVDAGLWRTWQNPQNPLDVNGDGEVMPLDALVLINHINASQSGPLPIPPVPPKVPPPFLDVSGNDEISPQDVLIVINYLNRAVMGGGEGEAVALAKLAAPRSAPVWVPQAAESASGRPPKGAESVAGVSTGWHARSVAAVCAENLACGSSSPESLPAGYQVRGDTPQAEGLTLLDEVFAQIAGGNGSGQV